MDRRTWNDILRLLDNWYKRVIKEQITHVEAARRFANRNYAIGIPSIALSAIVGTALFANLDEKDFGTAYRIGIGAVSCLAAVLSSLQTFLGFAQRSERHRQSASRFAAIRREIEQTITLTLGNCDNPDEFLKQLRDKIDAATENSPEIPTMIASDRNFLENLNRQIGSQNDLEERRSLDSEDPPARFYNTEDGSPPRDKHVSVKRSPPHGGEAPALGNAPSKGPRALDPPLPTGHSEYLDPEKPPGDRSLK